MSEVTHIATLRKVATDPDKEMRQKGASAYSRGRKMASQSRSFLDGLKNPDKALVPPEKALQLLSYDIHAEAYPVARAIISKPPNADAKREALRVTSRRTPSRHPSLKSCCAIKTKRPKSARFQRLHYKHLSQTASRGECSSDIARRLGLRRN